MNHWQFHFVTSIIYGFICCRDKRRNQHRSPSGLILFYEKSRYPSDGGSFHRREKDADRYSNYFPSEVEWSVTHAARSGECREECCERGYYHLHRKLNEAFLVHSLMWNVECEMWNEVSSGGGFFEGTKIHINLTQIFYCGFPR